MIIENAHKLGNIRAFKIRSKFKQLLVDSCRTLTLGKYPKFDPLYDVNFIDLLTSKMIKINYKDQKPIPNYIPLNPRDFEWDVITNTYK